MARGPASRTDEQARIKAGESNRNTEGEGGLSPMKEGYGRKYARAKKAASPKRGR